MKSGISKKLIKEEHVGLKSGKQGGGIGTESEIQRANADFLNTGID